MMDWRARLQGNCIHLETRVDSYHIGDVFHYDTICCGCGKVIQKVSEEKVVDDNSKIFSVKREKISPSGENKEV